MGLLQRAVETYECNLDRVGEYSSGQKEPLAPIYHAILKATIEITIDETGKFISASRITEGNEKTIAPVTEDSIGRAGTKAYTKPHYLCDKLSYLTAKDNYFLPQLEEWVNSEYSHPMAAAVYACVKNGKILEDLKVLNAGEDDVVRWIVDGLGDESGPCWRDKKLIESFVSFLTAKLEDRQHGICFISGKNAVTAKQHPKGIIALNGNAKLISANDSSGFTYRGRFIDDVQAATVSYESSQKAHNALRWMISNQGAGIFGGRTFLCWNPQGIVMHNPLSSLLGADAEVKSTPTDYKAQLNATLFSLNNKAQLKGTEAAVIAAFDAATTGRLALTYYKEMAVPDFLERLKSWDEHCCWWNGKFGIQAPSLFGLVSCAFGIQREEKGKLILKPDDGVSKQQMQSLLSCRLDGGNFPKNIKQALVNRASFPQAFDESVWRKILYTACSAINISEYQKKGEEIMSWELDKPDRSFQFGRLLAAMERAENDFYYASQDNVRQANAIKLMSVFRKRPWTVYEQVNRQLNLAYLPRIKPWQKKRYEKLKDEIVGIISTFPEDELNRPLNELYLMGYDMQHRAFFNSNDINDTEEN